MAKKEENKLTIESIAQVNEENFSESLRNANVFSKEVVEKAKENREKEEAERQAREFQEIADKSAYINLKLVAQRKYYKKGTEAMAEASKASLDLVNEVSQGKLTALEYDKKLKEIVDAAEKKIEAIGKEFRNDKNELRNKFNRSWSYDWDNPFARLNRAMENELKR